MFEGIWSDAELGFTPDTIWTCSLDGEVMGSNEILAALRDGQHARDVVLDLLKGDDGQAWKEAEKFIDRTNDNESYPFEKYVAVTMQQIIDSGLNAFAVKLISESISKNQVIEPIRFRYRNVGITIDPINNQQGE